MLALALAFYLLSAWDGRRVFSPAVPSGSGAGVA
jgi:hypothetical protein